MNRTDVEQNSHKGKAFFDRGDEVAETGNWDFAIEMYLEGIQRDPDNIERGHQPLREVALKRKAQGGKGPGMIEQLKRRGGKDPVSSLVNAEYLLAKQPGSVQFMEQLLKAAKALELPKLVKWICDILLEAQRQAAKPNKRILLLLTESYDRIKQFASAIAACEMAQKLAPDDGKIAEAIKELGANYTIQQGKYDQDGDFTKSVLNLEKQQEMIRAESMVQDRSYLERRIAQARAEYEESPTVAGKIGALVDALLKIEEDDYENQAIGILRKAYEDSGSYRFKMRIGDIKIRRMTRRYRELVAAGDKQAAAQAAREQLKFELGEYAERERNYPTDLGIKFELGRRQLLAGRYDEAISSLQEARRDPRHHVQGMNYLGQAFAGKGWLREAAETYERALQTEMSEDRSKEMRYNLADTLEKMGESAKAQEHFSQIAQLDYNYKDVRQRVEKLRGELGDQTSGQ